MNHEEFLKAHGQEWGEVVQGAPFMQALSIMALSNLEYIRTLSDEQVKNDAVMILSALRATLKFEKGLYALAAVPVESNSEDLRTEYPNQIEENYQQHQLNNGR